MRTYTLGIICAGLAILIASDVQLAQQKTVRKPQSAAAAASTNSAPMTIDAQSALINKYCVGCHNDKNRSGNMSLAQFDLAHVEKTPELTEKIIRKVRVGLMPKAG